jgi:lysyl-tRNA synthetase class 2
VPEPPDAESHDHAANRLEKLRAIEALGIDPWGGRFDGHIPIGELRERRPVPFDDNPTDTVRVAGRLLTRRVQSKKLQFLVVRDQTGDIQVMLDLRHAGEAAFRLAELLDLGDLVGIDGVYGVTRRGEKSVRVGENGLTILGKSLEPHPTTYYGIEDIEYRLRHRYLDLVHNPDTLRRARERVTIIRTIRRFLDDRGFSEVETPTLHTIAGGAAARPFNTHHNALDIPLVLRIALELHLKRLLVGGMEKVYEIGRVFRNEGISPRHNPEFTMLELYQAYSDYRGMMDLTEQMFLACIDALGRGRQLSYAGHAVDFEPPWQRRAYDDLLREHAGVGMEDRRGVVEAARRNGIDPAGKEHDVLVHFLFEECVEKRLEGPVFVYDYPAALCPLTKRKRDNPAVAERFELYVRGMELANAYTELNDPITQEETFRRQLQGLSDEDSMARMDDDFVRALRHAMPPAGGLGVGIDRLCMLLTDTQTIRDVILFPLLRPEKK